MSHVRCLHLATIARTDGEAAAIALSAPAISLVVVAATWDAWRWLAIRLAPSPEEAASLVMVVVLLAVLALPRLIAGRSFGTVPLAPVAVLLLAYAAAAAFAPDIIAAAFAVTALLYVLYRAAFDDSPPLAFYGLVALALPVLPSLQMVLGYPMRLVSASITVALLELQGVAIARRGTLVTVGGETVQFDAPCSGVTMLWAMVLVALAVGLVHRFGVVRLGAALLLAGAAAIVSNAFRASSLVVAETRGINEWAPWLHEGTGLAAFIMGAVALWWALDRLARFGATGGGVA